MDGVFFTHLLCKMGCAWNACVQRSLDILNDIPKTIICKKRLQLFWFQRRNFENVDFSLHWFNWIQFISMTWERVQKNHTYRFDVLFRFNLEPAIKNFLRDRTSPNSRIDLIFKHLKFLLICLHLAELPG